MNLTTALWELLIPFIGTAAGASSVFFLKTAARPATEKLIAGFASGVMTAASIWSLIIPSLELCEGQSVKCFIPVLGMLSGVILLLLVNQCADWYLTKAACRKSKSFKQTAMVIFAVTLHNIPEGMVVGVVLASAMSSGSKPAAASATALARGIAIQNLPEGAIISMPLKAAGRSKTRSFLIGTLSGAVEPFFGILTLLLTGMTLSVLPFLLAFAAGAMIYVVVGELIPKAGSDGKTGLLTIGFMTGFILMLVLDVMM